MIVMNERRWANQILETGDLGDNRGLAIQVLARYFYWEEGLKKKAILERLDALLEQLIPDYNPVKWEPFLERAAVKAKKRKLIELDEIPVHKGEMDFISTIPRVQLRRLAFTMLVLARYFDTIKETNNHWINLEFAEVFRLACITATLEKQAEMYRALIDARFIEYSKRVGNNNARVLIMDDTETVYTVPDLRAIGHEYQLYCGEPYARCERCGVLFRQSAKMNRKYCKECSKRPAMAMRRYQCSDCGREVFVVSRNNASCRCAECQTKARKLINQRYYAKTAKKK